VNPVGQGKLPPNKFLPEDRTKISVAGVDLELVAAPGETDDHLYVWYPKKKVLFCGDDYYKAFPNLYTIRGTMYRDVRVWADSLDKMSKEGAEFLVTGHTRPVLGRAEVKDSLESYRDAIRSVFDQTIQGINRGLTPDQLAETVKFASQPRREALPEGALRNRAFCSPCHLCRLSRMVRR